MKRGYYGRELSIGRMTREDYNRDKRLGNRSEDYKGYRRPGSKSNKRFGKKNEKRKMEGEKRGEEWRGERNRVGVRSLKYTH